MKLGTRFACNNNQMKQYYIGWRVSSTVFVFEKILKKMVWNRNHPTNGIFSIILIIYRLLRAFGLLAFSIDYDEKQKFTKVHQTVFDWVWLIIAIITNALLMSFNALNKLNEELPSKMEKMGNILLPIGGCAITIFSIIMDMVNRKDIWKIVTTLNEVDEEVNNVHHPHILKAQINSDFVIVQFLDEEMGPLSKWYKAKEKFHYIYTRPVSHFIGNRLQHTVFECQLFSRF